MIDNQKQRIQLIDVSLRLMANFIRICSNMRHIYIYIYIHNINYVTNVKFFCIFVQDL